MMPFFSLLAAVLGILILIPLSIMGLSAIPWPILLVLLVLILWGSQRLIDRFNAFGFNGAMEVPLLDTPATTTAAPPANSPAETRSPLTIALKYRGQQVESPIPDVAPLPENSPQCYRGVPLSHTTPEPHPPSAPPAIPLRYRGIQR